MFSALLLTAFVGTALATPLIPRQVAPWQDTSSSDSCLSLRNSCNASTVDLSNFYNYPSCVMMTTCSAGVTTPSQVLLNSGTTTDQPRLPESTFSEMSGGKSYMTQQDYIDAYYHAISVTPGGLYPDDVDIIISQWEYLAAWTGFCDPTNIPYSNFADWIQYSSLPGTCPAVQSCGASLSDSAATCEGDDGSCYEVAFQCQAWVTQGLFQNEYCVLASFCYAWSSTDDLIREEYPSYWPTLPTSLTEERLSEAVFYNMTGGAPTMSQQNVIDAYYSALTGVWVPLGGPFGAETSQKSDKNGPYPPSPQFVIDFWSIISAWTGFCDTREIPYDNLADYLTYAATSGYRPTC